MSSPEIEERIRAADARRRRHLTAFPHDAWRLINGPADGAPGGFSADFYGPWLVVNARNSVPRKALEAWCDALWSVFSPPGILLKTLAERISDSTSRIYRGTLPPGPVAVREAGVTLLCRLNEDLATGLYLDLHDVRRWFGGQVSGQEVLNLFSYTGSFSVHAAHGGARRVTSVDVSKRALDRGRENMEASGLDPSKHRWFADDVLSHLSRAINRGDQYDWIIMDPPAFGRAHNKIFELKKGLSGLLENGLQLLSPRGRLIVSIHTAGFEAGRLMTEIRTASARIGRTTDLLMSFGLPEWDHPVLDENPGDRGDYLQVLVVGAKCA